MLPGNVLPNSTVTPTMNAVAAGVTTQTGTHIDHDGARSIVHRLITGTATAGQTGTVVVQQGDLADDSDMADVAGLTYALVDADSDTVVSLELTKPSKRYSRIVVRRGGANLVIKACIAERFNISTSIPPVTRAATDKGNVTKSA
jgi:hypothetical protein